MLKALLIGAGSIVVGVPVLGYASIVVVAMAAAKEARQAGRSAYREAFGSAPVADAETPAAVAA